MNETFRAFLESEGVDGAAIRHATRYYIAEVSGDLLPSEMRGRITEAGANESLLNEAQKQLEADPLALENACLALLAMAWEKPADRQAIRNAFAEAKKKLPVIELGIIATVAMYAMYLAVTDGKTKTTIEHKPDGTYTETTEYHAPTGPLNSLAKLIGGGR